MDKKIIIVQVTQVRFEVSEQRAQSNLTQKIAAMLHVQPTDIEQVRISRLSLDARKKQDIHYRATIEVALPASFIAHIAKINNASIIMQVDQQELEHGNVPLNGRPVIVGAGPCGLFATWLLAKEGYQPILVEQGKPISERVSDVVQLFASGKLNLQSNILFGEGGAGTFSDGKLTWRGKDIRGNQVLQCFVECGAPEEILYQSKAHIGTDLLRDVILNLRKKIIELGGDIYFEHKVTDFIYDENNQLKNIIAQGSAALEIDTNVCVLALGHSARDTFETLFAQNVAMEAKAFAVGFRIEHPQTMINEAQYGTSIDHQLLPNAEYQLTQTIQGRGVYSFCMCPGGQVVCSSSEEDMLCCNGMSFHARAGDNANSAIVAQITPADFGHHPLDGIRFQRQWEAKAFALGGGNYTAPIQCVGDFLQNKPTKKIGAVIPSYEPNTNMTALNEALPYQCIQAIQAALPMFGRKIRGFDRADAILTGVETRTSSPLRVLRNEQHESISHKGIFPAGEGAGYAGGIMSAAIDGIRVAESIISRFAQSK